MDPAGKVALVTGGARRVGRALSLGLARAGADIVINYHEAADEAAETAREIIGLGRRAIAIRADISEKAEVTQLIDETAETFGRLDILVNNASTYLSTPFLGITEEEWDHVLGVNLKGPFLLSQAAAPLLQRDGGGVIVNISDLSGLQPWSEYPHHSVSKAGLIHLTEVMARALAPEIRVNCIAPGTVLPPDDYTEDRIRESRAKTALNRIGSPDDVVRALLFLIESEFATGETLVIDGGRRLL